MHPTPLAEAVKTGFVALAATLALARCTAKDVAEVAGCVEGLLSRVARGRRPALRP